MYMLLWDILSWHYHTPKSMVGKCGTQWWFRLLTHICVTGPQRIDTATYRGHIYAYTHIYIWIYIYTIFLQNYAFAHTVFPRGWPIVRRSSLGCIHMWRHIQLYVQEVDLVAVPHQSHLYTPLWRKQREDNFSTTPPGACQWPEPH